MVPRCYLEFATLISLYISFFSFSFSMFRFYVIIVIPGEDAEKLNGSRINAYDKGNPSKPYITGVLSEYREEFTVGDENKYSLKKTQQRNSIVRQYRRIVRDINTNKYQNISNVKLRRGVTYSVLVLAYEDDVSIA